VHNAVLLATTDSSCVAHCHNQWGQTRRLTRKWASVNYIMLYVTESNKQQFIALIFRISLYAKFLKSHDLKDTSHDILLHGKFSKVKKYHV
jgi:hypothetical protein